MIFCVKQPTIEIERHKFTLVTKSYSFSLIIHIRQHNKRKYPPSCSSKLKKNSPLGEMLPIISKNSKITLNLILISILREHFFKRISQLYNKFVRWVTRGHFYIDIYTRMCIWIFASRSIFVFYKNAIEIGHVTPYIFVVRPPINMV